MEDCLLISYWARHRCHEIFKINIWNIYIFQVNIKVIYSVSDCHLLQNKPIRYANLYGKNANSPRDRKAKVKRSNTATENPRDQRSREVKECRELNVTLESDKIPPFAGRWWPRGHQPADTPRGRRTQACAAWAPSRGSAVRLASSPASPAGWLKQPEGCQAPLGGWQPFRLLSWGPHRIAVGGSGNPRLSYSVLLWRRITE